MSLGSWATPSIKTPQLPTLPQVRVEFPHKDPLCSASKPGAPSRQMVVVPPNSSKMVPFVLLPLETGKVDVEVKVVGYGVQDHVKKTLSVQVMDSPSFMSMGGSGGPRINKHSSQVGVGRENRIVSSVTELPLCNFGVRLGFKSCLGCVTLGNALNFSEPPFPQLQTGNHHHLHK